MGTTTSFVGNGLAQISCQGRIFWQQAATRSGRQALSEVTGISETVIIKRPNHYRTTDMMRVFRTGPQFAELLEAGVCGYRERLWGTGTGKNLFGS
jgi:hypothetical protein